MTRLSALKPTRRMAIIGAAMLALAACGGSNASDGAGTTGGMNVTANDIVLGDADAPITVVEYASWTCGACYGFHNEVMPTLKSDYIETGKVRFVFREFPTAPAEVTIAGFAAARCAGGDNTYAMIDDLFENQAGLLAAIRAGKAREAIQGVAARHGIDTPEKFDACMADKSIIDTIRAIVADANERGVSSTPTLFINGRLEDTIAGRSADGMKSLLDAELTALGVQ